MPKLCNSFEPPLTTKKKGGQIALVPNPLGTLGPIMGIIKEV